MAVTADNKSCIDALSKYKCWVRPLELCDVVGIGKPAVISIIHDFGYNKVCA
jgi:hypothetical protein